MSDSTHLRLEALRCFRLARGPSSARLADELEALGLAFEKEARDVEAGKCTGRVSDRGGRTRMINRTRLGFPR